MKKLAIIMTVFNRLDKTEKCIDCLEQTLINIPHTYYITNDGSTDGTAVYLDKMKQHLDIVCHDGDSSLYWNRGMYHSYERALKDKYEFYLWVNNDTMFFQNMWKIMLADLTKAMERNKYSVVCGAVRSADNHEVTYGGTNENGLIKPMGDIKTCTHINGNCLLIPSVVATKVGNLDYRYEHGLGDFDYGQRILKIGGALYCSSKFIGTCEKNSVKGTWMDKSLPALKRIKLMKSKLGQPRKSYKIYLKKWNKKNWILYYYKPYFDIFLDSLRKLFTKMNNKDKIHD